MLKRLLVLGMVLMLLTGLLSGCTSGNTTAAATTAVAETTAAESTAAPSQETDTDGAYNIGFVTNNIGADDYQTYYDKYFREYAAMYPDVNVTVLDAKGDINTQLSMIDTMIQKKVDLLLVWASDSKGIVAGLKKASDAGITTVCCNNPIDPSGDQYLTTWVGPDVYGEGKAAAEAVNAAYPNGANFVCIPGMTGYDTVTIRLNGFTENVNSNIKILDTQFGKSFSREDAQKIMETYLATYGEQIDGVFTLDDNIGIGAAQAIESLGAKKMGIYFAAFIGSKESVDFIKDGTLAAGVLQHPYEDSTGTFDVCYKILTEGPDSVDSKMYIELYTCTTENVEQIMTENNLEIF